MGHFFYTLIIYPIKQIIEFAFMLFLKVFHNEGISIIGVSFAVSMLCLPLYIIAEHWQQVERDTEKKLEGGVKRIKETFKGDEQYMILSTYYRENHYHPLMALRSSFGLLIQIPFFIAAYSYLSSLPALKGESWLFIRDMGTEDALFHIGNFPINVLPIAMTLINIIAGAIYTKGFKLRDKIQTYGMALIFLVILYRSPAGLVLYWTMNNVFSLVKNVFYKIKNPLKVLYILMAAAVVLLDLFLLFFHEGKIQKRILMILIVSLVLFIPLIVKGILYLLNNKFTDLTEHKKTRLGIFILSSISLTLLLGFVIPSYVISSSPVEFANIDNYGSPLYFLYNSTLQAAGLVILWMCCIYFLFHEKIQTIIALVLSMFVLTGLSNAFIFGGDYGLLSRLITFSQTITTPKKSLVILNLFVMLILIVLPAFLVAIKKTKILSGLLSVVVIAEVAISGIHLVQIQSSYSDYKKTSAEEIASAQSVEPVFHLSKTGKNVFVFMLDRAENAYVEPIFNAYPELYEQFDGFTLYRNTVSCNGWTLMGSVGLYGGYEYTPYESNKRADEKLLDKHNQALLLMPRVFTEQSDFNATVSDLSWANFNWIPDMRICEPYEKITGLNVERKYTSLYMKENPDKVKPNITSDALKRNLLYFSLFKTSPYILRDSIYNDGKWWSSDDNTSDIMDFIDYYSELAFLKRLTDFSGDSNEYFTIVNETTHSNQKLQAPNYEPAINITDKVPDALKGMGGGDVNVAALKRLGEWFDYLRENDCYDNSRIILVADHGIGSQKGKEFDFPENWPFDYNPDHLHPLLMVKDFNANGKLVVNNDFMTNADVPSLAFDKIIENPKNPFTQNEIRTIPPEQKKAIVTITHNWQPGANTQNTYKLPDNDWFTISKNMFDAENWKQGIHE